MRLELALIVGIVFFCCWCAYIVAKMNSPVATSQHQAPADSSGAAPTTLAGNILQRGLQATSQQQRTIPVESGKHLGNRVPEANSPALYYVGAPSSSASQNQQQQQGQLISQVKPNSQQQRPSPMLASWPQRSVVSGGHHQEPQVQYQHQTLQQPGGDHFVAPTTSGWPIQSQIGQPSYKRGWFDPSASGAKQSPYSKAAAVSILPAWPMAGSLGLGSDPWLAGARRRLGPRAPGAPLAGDGEQSTHLAAATPSQAAGLEEQLDGESGGQQVVSPEGEEHADGGEGSEGGGEGEGGADGGEGQEERDEQGTSEGVLPAAGAVNSELDEQVGRRSFSEDFADASERDRDGRLVVTHRRHLINGRPVTGKRSGAKLGSKLEPTRQETQVIADGDEQQNTAAFDRLVNELDDEDGDRSGSSSTATNGSTGNGAGSTEADDYDEDEADASSGGKREEQQQQPQSHEYASGETRLSATALKPKGALNGVQAAMQHFNRLPAPKSSRFKLATSPDAQTGAKVNIGNGDALVKNHPARLILDKRDNVDDEEIEEVSAHSRDSLLPKSKRNSHRHKLRETLSAQQWDDDSIVSSPSTANLSSGKAPTPVYLDDSERTADNRGPENDANETEAISGDLEGDSSGSGSDEDREKSAAAAAGLLVSREIDHELEALLSNPLLVNNSEKFPSEDGGSALSLAQRPVVAKLGRVKRESHDEGDDIMAARDRWSGAHAAQRAQTLLGPANATRAAARLAPSAVGRPITGDIAHTGTGSGSDVGDHLVVGGSAESAQNFSKVAPSTGTAAASTATATATFGASLLSFALAAAQPKELDSESKLVGASKANSLGRPLAAAAAAAGAASSVMTADGSLATTTKTNRAQVSAYSVRSDRALRQLPLQANDVLSGVSSERSSNQSGSGSSSRANSQQKEQANVAPGAIELESGQEENVNIEVLADPASGAHASELQQQQQQQQQGAIKVDVTIPSLASAPLQRPSNLVGANFSSSALPALEQQQQQQSPTGQFAGADNSYLPHEYQYQYQQKRPELHEQARALNDTPVVHFASQPPPTGNTQGGSQVDADQQQQQQRPTEVLTYHPPDHLVTAHYPLASVSSRHSKKKKKEIKFKKSRVHDSKYKGAKAHSTKRRSKFKKGGSRQKKEKSKRKLAKSLKEFSGAARGHKAAKGTGQRGGKKGTIYYKDKGYKKRGFKKNYQKTESGDHKTYFDEFRDKDHNKKWKEFQDKHHYSKGKKWAAKDRKKYKNHKFKEMKDKKSGHGSWKEKESSKFRKDFKSKSYGSKKGKKKVTRKKNSHVDYDDE